MNPGHDTYRWNRSAYHPTEIRIMVGANKVCLFFFSTTECQYGVSLKGSILDFHSFHISYGDCLYFYEHHFILPLDKVERELLFFK